MIEIDHNILDIISNINIIKDIKRTSIARYLFEKGEEGASFKNISIDCSIPPTGLVYHLNIMRRSGLINRDYKDGKGREYTRYSLTGSGISTFMFLDDAVETFEDRCIDYPESLKIIPMETGLRLFKLKEL